MKKEIMVELKTQFHFKYEYLMANLFQELQSNHNLTITIFVD
jgi:hypothetical protein